MKEKGLTWAWSKKIGAFYLGHSGQNRVSCLRNGEGEKEKTLSGLFNRYGSICLSLTNYFTMKGLASFLESEIEKIDLHWPGFCGKYVPLCGRISD